MNNLFFDRSLIYFSVVAWKNKNNFTRDERNYIQKKESQFLEVNFGSQFLQEFKMQEFLKS